MSNATTATTKTAKPASEAKATSDKPKRTRRNAVQRLQEELAAAQAKAAKAAVGRIDKAQAEVAAAQKDYDRAELRLNNAKVALAQLQEAAGVAPGLTVEQLSKLGDATEATRTANAQRATV